MENDKAKLIAAGCRLADESASEIAALARLYALHGQRLVPQWNKRKACLERLGRKLEKLRATNAALDKHPGILSVRRERQARAQVATFLAACPGRFFRPAALQDAANEGLDARLSSFELRRVLGEAVKAGEAETRRWQSGLLVYGAPARTA